MAPSESTVYHPGAGCANIGAERFICTRTKTSACRRAISTRHTSTNSRSVTRIVSSSTSRGTSARVATHRNNNASAPVFIRGTSSDTTCSVESPPLVITCFIRELEYEGYQEMPVLRAIYHGNDSIDMLNFR